MSQPEAKPKSKWRSVSVGSKPASLEEKVRKPRSSFVDIVNRVISKQRKISLNFFDKVNFTCRLKLSRTLKLVLDQSKKK